MAQYCEVVVRRRRVFRQRRGHANRPARRLLCRQHGDGGRAARRASEVTHAHPEGIAGGIAVTVASAIAWRFRESGERPSMQGFLEAVLPHVPESDVAEGIRRAATLNESTSVAYAVSVLGNGCRISAQDAVPFCLWCAGEFLNDYEEAIWAAVTSLGDVDTNCAIVGGIVACYTGAAAIPLSWRESRERFPPWFGDY